MRSVNKVPEQPAYSGCDEGWRVAMVVTLPMGGTKDLLDPAAPRWNPLRISRRGRSQGRSRGIYALKHEEFESAPLQDYHRAT